MPSSESFTRSASSPSSSLRLAPRRATAVKVARGLARHRLQLPAVRHDDRRAAVTPVVAALRVDERGNPLRARRLEEGGREGQRERALRVVGEKEHVGGVHGLARGREERALRGRRQLGRELLVHAQHLASLGDHAALDGRRPQRVDDDRARCPRQRREPPREPRALLARPHGAQRDDARSEAREVFDDVSGAARAPAHRHEGKQRDGRLRRHALDGAHPRLVEHEVSRDRDRDAGRRGRERGDLTWRHGASALRTASPKDFSV